jgi:hypothetical protein
MNTALQMMIQAAAGTGGPTDPNSRYLNTPIEMLTKPDGTQVAYLQRRIIPQMQIYTSVQNYVVIDGDRLDNLAFKFLGNPLLFWMLCDANGVSDPESLTGQIGSTILIPIASAIPSGAQNG